MYCIVAIVCVCVLFIGCSGQGALPNHCGKMQNACHAMLRRADGTACGATSFPFPSRGHQPVINSDPQRHATLLQHGLGRWAYLGLRSCCVGDAAAIMSRRKAGLGFGGTATFTCASPPGSPPDHSTVHTVSRSPWPPVRRAASKRLSTPQRHF